jgi:hypothetical protein
MVSEATQIFQDVPSDIDPEVLFKINALFSEPDPTMYPQWPALARRDSAGSSEARWEQHCQYLALKTTLTKQNLRERTLYFQQKTHQAL